MNKLSEDFKALLAFSRALTQAYQSAHWMARGPQFYGDHQLFGRLYESADGDVDTIAEKGLGVTGDQSIADPADQAKRIQHAVDSIAGSTLLRAEQAFMALCRDIAASGAASDARTGTPDTYGLDNFLSGLIDKHQGHVYLLRQRGGQ